MAELCRAILHLGNIGGLLVTDSRGYVKWRCPTCHASGEMRKPTRVRPLCKEVKKNG